MLRPCDVIVKEVESILSSSHSPVLLYWIWKLYDCASTELSVGGAVQSRVAVQGDVGVAVMFTGGRVGTVEGGREGEREGRGREGGREVHVHKQVEL